MSRGTLSLVWLALAAPAAALSPSELLRFEATPQQLSDNCEAAQGRARMRVQAIVQLPESAARFENTVAALDQSVWTLFDETASDTFLKDVSVSSSVRQAGLECQTALEKFMIDLFTREDLYAALKRVPAADLARPDDRRLHEKTLSEFRRNGLELPESERGAVKKLKERLVELEQLFDKNIAEVKDAVWFSREELDGMPDDYVARLETKDGKYRVSVDYPDYYPFMDNARGSEPRRKLERLFNNRASKQNLPLLREILALRAEIAEKLGYKTHAHYVLEERMAQEPARVTRFVERLVKKLKPLARAELKALSALKSSDVGPTGDPKIYAWDWRYYDNQLRKKRFDFDKEKVKEYFPLETVTRGMLDVYQRLLGLKFKKIEDGPRWHPDVQLYEVADASSGETLAYFYMDLFPREGKYKHAAAFDLLHGRALPDGSYRKPVAAMVANFTKPTKDRVSLLKHGDREEVETFFHEFGHIMHQTLTRARHGRFSGSNTARDFVEAPSQMLENWVWDPGVLASLSGHYLRPEEKLPKELLDKLIAARNHDSGLKNLRQMLFASVDMEYHTKRVKDTTAVWGRLAREVSLIPLTEGTHPEASFGHLTGYDAGYYGYMWSKVFAQDMFGRFAEEGLLNPAIGRRYREQILEPGGSRDENLLVRDFLGREPNEDAFLRSIGLERAKAKGR